MWAFVKQPLDLYRFGDMNINLLDDALHALNRAAAAAAREGKDAVAPEHILAGVISENASDFEELCARLGLETADLPETLTDVPITYEGHLPFTDASHEVLTVAVEHSAERNHEGVTSLHLFLGLARSEDEAVIRSLSTWDLDEAMVAAELDRAYQEAEA